MYNHKISFTSNLPICEDCTHFEEKKDSIIKDGKKVFTIRGCRNADICENAIERFKTMLQERSERPYDAMGDDQGRGETGDGWYQENFKEAEAYRDNKIPEKLVTNDSVVKNPEAYSR